MTLNQILLGSLIYLAATVISAPLAKRLGLGSVLGFLVAGALIGPSALGIIGSHDETVVLDVTPVRSFGRTSRLSTIQLYRLISHFNLRYSAGQGL